jgi:hypothetical protein
MDVLAAAPSPAEWLRVTTKQVNWKEPAASLTKDDVQSVSYVRFSPYTDREADLIREDVRLLAPQLWFRGLMLGKISVKLYDSSMPENNSALGCR